MSTINERFREAREELKLSQEDFASMANRTRSEIKNIEYNKTTPKEEVISAVIKAHNINPEFLRHGKKPIIMPDKDNESAMIERFMDEIDNPMRGIVAAIIKTYMESDPGDKEAIKGFAKKLLESKK